MTTRHRIVANLYKDSVALMAISSKLLALEGLDGASVVMATPTNLENLVGAGLGGDLAATKPSDLVVAVAGTDAACDAALALAEELLAEQLSGDGGSVAEQPPSSLQMAASRDPAVNFALVSVPGTYAAAEALKALRLGMSVMVFSDNVPEDQELAIKQFAADRGLMVMGPDCGTAIVNGLPLGFANVVRRGPIGVVGASGTGLQEVTSRIHNLGSGISQALGTGGHDLSEAIGGISMLTGLKALERDVDTRSSSWSPSRRRRPWPGVCSMLRAMTTPVVVIFLGADPASFSDDVVRGRHRWPARPGYGGGVGLGRRVETERTDLDPAVRGKLDDAARRGTGPAFHPGIFCGGTFCYEAQLIGQAAGIRAWSNTPVAATLVGRHPRQPRKPPCRHGRRRLHAGPAASDDRPVAAQRAHRTRCG
jgi:succinyl-CoA synthetase alpha subunit